MSWNQPTPSSEGLYWARGKWIEGKTVIMVYENPGHGLCAHLLPGAIKSGWMSRSSPMTLGGAFFKTVEWGGPAVPPSD